MKKYIRLFLAFLVLSPLVRADKFDGWQSYTATSEIRYIDFINDSIQVMTSGGWLKIDPNTLGMKKLVNNDGIGTNDLHFIMQDENQVIWIAGHGRLVKSSNGIYTPYIFYDRNDNLLTLNSLADDDDQLWIATSSGLALFSKDIDGGQIEDFYFRFGNLTAEPVVKDILILNDTIWIATSDGLAAADKSDPNLLKSFSNWGAIRPTDFSVSSTDNVTALAYFRGDIYLGTTADVFRLDITAGDTSLIDLPTNDDIVVKHLRVSGDSLLIYADGGFFVYDGSTVEWNDITSIPDRAFVSGILMGNTHWLGDFKTGLYYGSGILYEKYDDKGIPGNYAVSLSINNAGTLAGAFHTSGAAIFDGTSWEFLSEVDVRDGVIAVSLDNHGNVWFGDWGDGVSFIGPDTVIYFKENNSSLRGVAGDPNYVVVSRMAATSNYIFMVNLSSGDFNTVRWVDINDKARWGSFGLSDGLPGDFLEAISASDDVFVVGTLDKGIHYYYFGPDPEDKSDDSVVNLTEANSWLGSNEIRSIEFDNNNSLWVGTKFGLSRYDYGIDQFINVNLPLGFGPEINCLTFDSRDNIWMGAGNGLARFDAGSGTISVFTTLNSGLTDDEITSLAVSPITGDLWIGTRRGISRLSSDIGQPVENIVQVVAFPNPFVIRGDEDALAFNYSRSAIVRIYSVNGELIWENDINIPWRGKNQDLRDVAPGVYLFMLTADDGSTGKGKILLVRK